MAKVGQGRETGLIRRPKRKREQQCRHGRPVSRPPAEGKAVPDVDINHPWAEGIVFTTDKGWFSGLWEQDVMPGRVYNRRPMTALLERAFPDGMTRVEFCLFPHRRMARYMAVPVAPTTATSPTTPSAPMASTTAALTTTATQPQQRRQHRRSRRPSPLR